MLLFVFLGNLCLFNLWFLSLAEHTEARLPHEVHVLKTKRPKKDLKYHIHVSYLKQLCCFASPTDMMHSHSHSQISRKTKNCRHVACSESVIPSTEMRKIDINFSLAVARALVVALAHSTLMSGETIRNFGRGN